MAQPKNTELDPNGPPLPMPGDTPAPRKVLPLLQTRFQLAEEKRTAYRIVPLDGVTLEDVQKPGYWANVSRDLKIGDKLEILAEDMSWYAELLVRDVGQTGARTSVLGYKEFEDEDEASASGLEAKYNPALGWTVQTTDKPHRRLAEKLPSKEAALRWIADNPRAV